MSKHTQEPWVLFEVGERHVYFCPGSAKEKTSILTVTEEGGVSFAAVYKDEDARRIVACVNACRGLPTDELEQKGLVAAVGTELLELDRHCDELLDELAIILGSLKEICHHRQVPLPEATIRRAERAIAKAKGGAA